MATNVTGRLTKEQPALLAVAPTCHVFNSDEDPNASERLHDLLKKHYEQTENLSVSDPSSVMIHRNGLVNGKYQLTTPALSHLCSSLATGLSLFIRSLAGLSSCDKQVQDVETAIAILNKTIALRFDRLNGSSLVLDRETGRIEGVVGRKYEFFPNLALFERTREFISSAKAQPSVFKEAALEGRRMMLRYQSRDQLFEIRRSDRPLEPFFGGFHFANSEVGQCSVRAASVLIRQICSNGAISPFFDGGKIPHIRGSRFNAKLSKLLSRVETKAVEATGPFKERIIGMMDKPLGVAGDLKEQEARRLQIVNQLYKKGITKTMAESVLSRALLDGSYSREANLTTMSVENEYPTRTVYDLFNALTSEAKLCGIADREYAEMIAYQMLTGKFELR